LLVVDLRYCYARAVLLLVDLQQGVRDPRLHVGFVIKFADQPLRNLRNIDVHVVLDRDIDLRSSRTNVTGQASMAFQRLPQRI